MEVEIKTGPIITPEKLELLVDEKQKDIRSIVAGIIPLPVGSFDKLISDDIGATDIAINARGVTAVEVIKQIFQDTSLAQVWAQGEKPSIDKLNIYFSSFTKELVWKTLAKKSYQLTTESRTVTYETKSFWDSIVTDSIGFPDLNQLIIKEEAVDFLVGEATFNLLNAMTEKIMKNDGGVTVLRLTDKEREEIKEAEKMVTSDISMKDVSFLATLRIVLKHYYIDGYNMYDYGSDADSNLQFIALVCFILQKRNIFYKSFDEFPTLKSHAQNPILIRVPGDKSKRSDDEAGEVSRKRPNLGKEAKIMTIAPEKSNLYRYYTIIEVLDDPLPTTFIITQNIESPDSFVINKRRGMENVDYTKNFNSRFPIDYVTKLVYMDTIILILEHFATPSDPIKHKYLVHFPMKLTNADNIIVVKDEYIALSYTSFDDMFSIDPKNKYMTTVAVTRKSVGKIDDLGVLNLSTLMTRNEKDLNESNSKKNILVREAKTLLAQLNQPEMNLNKKEKESIQKIFDEKQDDLKKVKRELHVDIVPFYSRIKYRDRDFISGRVVYLPNYKDDSDKFFVASLHKRSTETGMTFLFRIVPFEWNEKEQKPVPWSGKKSETHSLDLIFYDPILTDRETIGLDTTLEIINFQLIHLKANIGLAYLEIDALIRIPSVDEGGGRRVTIHTNPFIIYGDFGMRLDTIDVSPMTTYDFPDPIMKRLVMSGFRIRRYTRNTNIGFSYVATNNKGSGISTVIIFVNSNTRSNTYSSRMVIVDGMSNDKLISISPIYGNLGLAYILFEGSPPILYQLSSGTPTPITPESEIEYGLASLSISSSIFTTPRYKYITVKADQLPANVCRLCHGYTRNKDSISGRYFCDETCQFMFCNTRRLI